MDDSTETGTNGEVAEPESRQQDRTFSQRILDIGFLTGLLLALFCLGIAGWYLISYQTFASSALQMTVSDRPPTGPALAIHIYLARALLQSCGLATGMAFGFLGFSLFLLGVRGSIDATASHGQVALQVARISPGAFVMLCSSILVGICATSDIPARMGGSSSAEQPAGADEGEEGDAGEAPVARSGQVWGGLQAGNTSEEAEEMNRIEQQARERATAETEREP